MTPLAYALLWCALQVSLFLCLAGPVYLAARRRNPRLGTLTAAGSLAVVIILSALAASPWPRWSWESAADGMTTEQVLPSITSSAAGAVAPADDADTAGPAGQVAAPTTIPPQGSTLAVLWNALRGVAEPAAGPNGESSSRWPAAIVAVAAVGVGLSAVHLAAGLATVWRLVERSRPLDNVELTSELGRLKKRLSIPGDVALRESAEIVTPATVGCRRPAILLPPAWRQWSAIERQSVIAHELAHVARRDFAAGLLGRLASALHFYHPLVRWFAARLQLEQELAADAAAAGLVGGRDAYLHALASLALATPAHRLQGPARTFIPSRSLLIRRVDMLRTHRDWLPASRRRMRMAQWTAGILLATLGVGAAGVRPPARQLHAAEPARGGQPPVAEAQSNAAGGYDFEYLPDDYIALLAFRPSDMAASPRLKPIAELLDKIMQPSIPAAALEQVTTVMPMPKRDERGRVAGASSEYTVFRTSKPIDFTKAIAADYREVKAQRHNGGEIITWGQSDQLLAFYAPDDRTLISHAKRPLIDLIDDPQFADPPAGVERWREKATGPVFAVIDVKALRETLGVDDMHGNPAMQMFQPLVELAERVIVSIDDEDPLLLRAEIVCGSAQQAAEIEPTVQAALVLLHNVIDAQIKVVEQDPSRVARDLQRPMMKQFELAADILESVKIEHEDETLVLTATIGEAPTVVAMLVPQVLAAREAAQRVQSQNNLKQMALAAYNYHDSFGSFPPAVVYGKSAYGDLNPSGDRADDVPRSWRVELLPMLEQQELYKQYRLDEPWDSENNRKVLAQMPAVYRSPSDSAGSKSASYFALTGVGAVFDDRDGTKVTEITDGTSNTLLFVEAKRDTPWTKPEDIPYGPKKELPELGGWHKGVFLGALADGSVQIFKPSGLGDGLRAWIEKADGKTPPREGQE